MSQSMKHNAPCPGCGRELEFTLWQSINTETENAREDIISGKLFDVVCPDCGYKARVQYPILSATLSITHGYGSTPRTEPRRPSPSLRLQRKRACAAVLSTLRRP